MTKKIAVSLPDDVARRLAQEENVSAYVAEAVRRRMASEETQSMLRGVGFALSDYGLARAGDRLEAARAAITPELRDAAVRLLADNPTA